MRNPARQKRRGYKRRSLMIRVIVVARASVLLAALSLLMVGTAQAQVEAGVDCWETQVGSSASVGPFPPGFFGDVGGMLSDPLPDMLVFVEGVPLPPATCPCDDEPVEWFDEHGNPVEPDDIHKVSQKDADYDTCVERPTDADFGGGVGVPESVPIEIIELSLKSVDPIVVTYNGGNNTDCDLFIELDGAQGLGSIEMIPSSLGPGSTGSMELEGLPVNLRISYLCTGPGATGASQTQGGLNTNFEGSTGKFGPDLVPALGGWTLGLAVLGLMALGCFGSIRLRQRRT
jgi:hypothetical protein